VNLTELGFTFVGTWISSVLPEVKVKSGKPASPPPIVSPRLWQADAKEVETLLAKISTTKSSDTTFLNVLQNLHVASTLSLSPPILYPVFHSPSKYYQELYFRDIVVKGKMTFSGVFIHEGLFYGGLLVGDGKETHISRYHHEGFFKNGRVFSVQSQFKVGGACLCNYPTILGLWDGAGKTVYINGPRIFRGHYRQGIREGRWHLRQIFVFLNITI